MDLSSQRGDVLVRRRDVVTMVTHPAHATLVFISLSAPPGPAFHVAAWMDTIPSLSQNVTALIHEG